MVNEQKIGTFLPIMTKYSTWTALRNSAFRQLWIASVISGTCVAAHDGAATWMNVADDRPKRMKKALRRKLFQHGGLFPSSGRHNHHEKAGGIDSEDKFSTSQRHQQTT